MIDSCPKWRRVLIFLIIDLLVLPRTSHSFLLLLSRCNNKQQQYVHIDCGRTKVACESEATFTISDDSTSNGIDTSVEILHKGRYFAVVNKPPGVVCHRNQWSGRLGEMQEVPMLQRVRDQLINDEDHEGGRRVANKRANLVHRLDRGASGCLLCTYDNCTSFVVGDDDDNNRDSSSNELLREVTRQLANALQSKEAIKTYIALTRGEGVLKGVDLKQKGWFEVNREIKDDKGDINSAQTMFRFISGVNYIHDDTGDNIRAGLVLARPKTGRWHQIRRHLNGLSHPILGDSSHGNSKTNREWRTKRGLPGERICLHLARIQIPATELTPEIDVSCPLPSDLMDLLSNYYLIEDDLSIVNGKDGSQSELHRETNILFKKNKI